jgi:threonyl-tRNA synthetase
VIGREETMSTIQLDFVAKERFGLTFTDADGSQNNEVFVIHRAPLSVHERLSAFLIEHYAGKFPVWLSPVQVKVLPITDAQNEYSQHVVDTLKAAGIRVEQDERGERLNAKIRDAQMEKVPYMLVVGGKEAEAGTVAVRNRDTGELTVLPLIEFVNTVVEQSQSRSG